MKCLAPNVIICPAECFIQRLYVLVLQIPHILAVSDRLVAFECERSIIQRYDN
ncbi:hypothetical protein [Scytonema millei]|uniref:Uncharacterized protein n=1 Tax=Scytonema millei VB511283 TaxID=1245923 RepID=A0A9X5E4R2_9CYAN|nr:hypothetical protein [Scytonema millei]NHC35246.1 hypothetical protein [Scytonema millei VB511283]